MNQKGFAPILIVILVALIAGAGGLLVYQKSKPATTPEPITQQPSPSPIPDASPVPTGVDETTNPDLIGANWKTYTNMEFGYSLKYPSTWTYKVSSKGSGQIILLPGDKELPPSEPSFVVVTVMNSIKQPLIQGDARNVLINKKYIKIAGAVDGEQGEFNGFIQTAVSHNNNSYYINLDKMEYRGIYDQILSTFKFTDQSYSCPKSEFINCMPQIGVTPPPANESCNPAYLDWAKANCPNFQGPVY